MYQKGTGEEMRKYNKNNKVLEIKCNCCGKDLEVEKGFIKSGNFSVNYDWGYFSSKDGETHKFDICEECYDKLIKSFTIPIDIDENNELM